MRVIYKGKPVSVPALSGNSFRGQLRDILADALCSRLSNQGKQLLRFNDNDVYTILYSGGALSEKSKAGDLIYAFSNHLPSMRLMGSAIRKCDASFKIGDDTYCALCRGNTGKFFKGCMKHLKNALFPQ